MDDGSNNQTDANIELNTQSFTVDEVEFLIERIKKDLGIDSHKKTGGKEGQYKIYIGRDSYFRFIEIIKPHVEWDCFKYKIDTSGYTKRTHRGETHSGSILTEEKVREIFRLRRDEGMLQKDIAEKVGSSNISAILSGEQWSHLGLSMPKVKKPRLSKEVKQQIADLQTQGLSQKQIADKLNINQSTVSRCANSRNYEHE
jgi:ribosome-binding protein aMBF1 (putative translation factor)